MIPRAGGDRPSVAVLSRSWGEPASEAGTAVRSLAGALSRRFLVEVLVAQPEGSRQADGAFDRIGIGAPAAGATWPDAAHAPAGGPPAHEGAPYGAVLEGAPYGAVLVDDGDVAAAALARSLFPAAALVVIGAGAAWDTGGAMGQASALDVGFHAGRVAHRGAGRGTLPVGLYVRVHPYAAERPHHELGGAAGYVLVLSGRDPAHATPARPSAQLRWLLARFARHRVVVVENAVATVFRSRSAVNRFGVHTRMDLWRLIAHARTTVDLWPGPLFARECVESLRYGVPVVVPAGTVADALVDAGGGAAFTSTAELLAAVEALGAPAARTRARTGREAVEGWYGDPTAFVERVTGALGRILA